MVLALGWRTGQVRDCERHHFLFGNQSLCKLKCAMSLLHSPTSPSSYSGILPGKWIAAPISTIIAS